MSFWKDSDRPELASEWSIEQQSADLYLARSEAVTRVLSGSVLPYLLPHIDGQRTVAQLESEAPATLRSEIQATLHLLREQGLIRPKPAAARSRGESAYWRLIGSDESRFKLTPARCRVQELAPHCRAPIEEALTSLGVTIAEDAAFRVVIARDYRDERLAAIDAESFAQVNAWMLVRPFGRRHWLGPLFVPGKTGCWHCLAWWLTINGWSASSVVAELPALTSATVRLAGVEAAKWLLSGQNESIRGRIREFDTGSLNFTDHHFLPRPGCSRCGSAASLPVELDQIRSPLTGVVAAADLIREWPGLAVYQAECSQRVAVSGSGGAYYCSPQTTFGVAETGGEAVKTCLAEAVERFSARFQGDQSIAIASLEQLGNRAVNPATLVPALVLDNPGTPIGWVNAISLTTGEPRLVPAGHVYLGYDLTGFDPATNGCAAGVDPRAALTAALLELIERDAVALWWYNRALRPAVDIGTVRSRRIDAALAAASKSGTQVHVLDLTTDFGIPACVAVAHGETPGIAIGCATHPDPELCVWKALAEMSAVLTRLVIPIPGRRQFLDHDQVEDHPQLLPHGSPVRWNAPPTDEPEILTFLVRRARDLGLEVFAIDLTRPELAIPVVRVIVPGLRPLARILTPGRLYDVPPRLGWISRPLNESEMNPVPFQL